jgi:predicted RNA-binding protein with TRAM domain
MRYHHAPVLRLRVALDLHERRRDALCRVVALDRTRVPDVVDPRLLELEQRVRAAVDELLERADLAADAHALDGELHALEVLGERALTAQVRGELRDHDRARGDGVHEFEREELPRADEAFVVFVDEVEREESVEVDEEEMDGQVRVRVRDEVEPIAARLGAVRRCRGGREG